MDRYNRIKSLDELRLPKDVALCEIFPLKKKSKIINPNDRDPSKRDPDSRGVKIIRVEHSKNSLMPDIKVGDVIIDVNGAPIQLLSIRVENIWHSEHHLLLLISQRNSMTQR